MRRFDRQSLLTLSRDGQRVSFHDLQHDFLRLNVDSVAAAQEALIDSYRSRCADGWATGPNDGYFFQHFPAHLVETGRQDELKALLADYAWLAAKLKVTDVPSVLADYERVPGEPHLGLIERALRLSTVALGRDPYHLPSQLLGRLRGVEDRRVQALLEQAEKAGAGPGTAWLCPHTASLFPPGSLVQTFKGHTSAVTALAVLPDGRVVSGSDDGVVILWDLETAHAMSTFVGDGDAAITACAAASVDRLVVGSANGAVHILEVVAASASLRPT